MAIDSFLFIYNFQYLSDLLITRVGTKKKKKKKSKVKNGMYMFYTFIPYLQENQNPHSNMPIIMVVKISILWSYDFTISPTQNDPDFSRIFVIIQDQ